jgi:hypothetical protein
MNRRFADAVIATFRQGSRDHCVRELLRFEARDWRRGWHWLDASGLALYFRQRIASCCLDEYVPAEVLNALDERLEDNRQRTLQLFSEFKAINNVFQKAGLHYVNLKGFTLIPDYCPDPSLRCQFDLDFMISESELALCQTSLEGCGYSVAAKHRNVVEFKAGDQQIPSIRDLYKSRSQSCVEVHLAPPCQAAGADHGVSFRRQNRVWNGVTFPALSDVDMFLAQADHLFRHLRSEWTRISWLLELQTFVTVRSQDKKFWQDVHNRAATTPDGALAVGAAVMLATEAFGDFAPPELLGWSMEAVSRSLRLWLDRYGKTVLSSNFPGTKLYLLLDGELSNTRDMRKTILGKLFPMHLPPRIGCRNSRGSVRANLSQIWFALFRLRFHIVEGSRFVIAAERWKRATSGQSGMSSLSGR